MMKRSIATVLASLFLLSASAGAQEMKAMFINMPDAFIPQLESAWRKDLVDLFTSGKEARLKNTFNGYSTLLSLTEDYIKVQSTDRTIIELKRLPLVNNTHIICMITTIYAPAPDSRLHFFTTDWQPLDSRQLFTPVDNAFFLKEDIDPDAAALLDIDLIRYTFEAGSTDLHAHYSTLEYLSSEARAKVAPFISSEVKVYTWEKAFFSK
jgi:hypothetical protein